MRIDERGHTANTVSLLHVDRRQLWHQTGIDYSDIARNLLTHPIEDHLSSPDH